MQKLKFGLLSRRWSHQDHIVVVGYNKASKRFFVLDKRQLGFVADECGWPFLGVHDPEKRLKRIMSSFDTGWVNSSVLKYLGSLTTQKRGVSHHHVVCLKSFEVPAAVLESKTATPLGYREFTREEVQSLRLPKPLQTAVAQACNFLQM